MDDAVRVAPRLASPMPAGKPPGARDEAANMARLLAILTGIAFVALVTAVVAENALVPVWAALLYALAYITAGYSGAVNSLAALRQGDFSVDVLMLIAALGAAAIGEPLEGGVLLWLFSLSEALQTYALGRTRGAIRSLMSLRPDTARVRSGDGTRVVPVEDLAVGDVAIVLPGERIPVDGVVEAGASEVDQATITGESVPVSRTIGEPVLAATVNGPGVLEVRTTRRASESTVARIIALVEEAQATRAPTQRLIDRYGNAYAWSVLLGSVSLGLVGALLLGWPRVDAIYRAITLLVVASPCAVVISTPAAYLSAMATAARLGILFKGGAYLEAAAAVDVVAIDKTGTLTAGRPELTEVVALGDRRPDEVLALAAALEARSEHLIAQAVVAGARKRGIVVDEHRATAVRARHGLGIQGRVDGLAVAVGRSQLFDAAGSATDAARSAVARLEAQGQTAMIVGVGPRAEPIGVLAVADAPRRNALAAIAALRAAGVKRIVMLSGDNVHAARAVARAVGIADDDVYAGMLPADKVARVEVLATQGPVAFVGDGVNDAPALAAASIGVAMGAAGSDVAMETADVVLVGDHIERLPDAFGIGRAARRIVRQNLAFGFGVIAVLVAATVFTGIPLPLGVVGHEGSTVLVVLNGLRLLAYRPALPAGG